MDDIKAFKEQIINNYISGIDYDVIDPNQIKRELHQMIGETPAVNLIYSQERILLEDGKSQKRVEKLEGVEVTFTYERQMMNSNGQLMDVPVPVTLKYRLA
jgi:hypothetical protein